MSDDTTMAHTSTTRRTSNPSGKHTQDSQGRVEPESKRPVDDPVSTRTASGLPVPSVERSGGDAPPQVSGGVRTSESPLGQMHALQARAGEQPWSPRVVAIVCAPIDDSLVEILPNGVIDVPHKHWRDRMNDAFGVGGWAHIPLASPKQADGEVAYYGMVKALGQFVGDAVGGCKYIPNNDKQTYADCVESAKSRSFKRCCKQLGMFLELWDKSYQDYWKSLYAEEVPMSGTRSGKGWRKKREYARKFQPRAEVIGKDRPLLLAANDEYNDNVGFDDDGREQE